MIKGVNKKVIEINRTDSAYFERAVLYLRPDVTEVSLHTAQTEADSYFAQTMGHRVRRRLRGWLVFLLGMATSAAVFVLISAILR